MKPFHHVYQINEKLLERISFYVVHIFHFVAKLFREQILVYFCNIISIRKKTRKADETTKNRNFNNNQKNVCISTEKEGKTHSHRFKWKKVRERVRERAKEETFDVKKLAIKFY